ncbi:hypothetical protein Mapa_016819 [Marchantia paleacea]|nr:hypothetical protein Mapa_016819 [Marchantia paleacea]
MYGPCRRVTIQSQCTSCHSPHPNSTARALVSIVSQLNPGHRHCHSTEADDSLGHCNFQIWIGIFQIGSFRPFSCSSKIWWRGEMASSVSVLRAPASSVSLLSLSSSSVVSNSGKLQSNVQIPAKGSSSTTAAPVVSMASDNTKLEAITSSRRELTVGAVVGALTAANNSFLVEDALAVSTSKRALRSEQIPASEFKTLPSGLKYYDIKVGSGATAVKGSRVAIHYVAKWKGITFKTSRQGLGVTGGSPYGFDVGASDYGIVLKGLDLGVEGMRVGGQRMLILPPELAYGDKGVQEIPPNATIEFNVELLSIKQSPFG